QLIVIDSIQTIASPYIESTPGSISQVRECTSDLQVFAKESNIPVFIIGHINKEGHIAGPKILEHIVDTVLQFEGDRNHIYRILRTNKNRFGSTDEIGIYAMEMSGLREVENPSELLLSQSDEKLSGSAVACTVEGIRPMLIETQALVSQAIYGTPQRSATGFDLRRLSMLLAVLEKRAGLFFGQSDVFMNIAGGLKVQDTAIDIAIVAALVSSLQNIPVNKKICFSGEVGLTGEIRAVTRIDQRIEEARRLGFEKIYISSYNKFSDKPNAGNIEIIQVAKIEDLVASLFG
ncbi:MAG: DNA repair protein RadA, partial [Saprospiraceae bacterium]|nr:DNA repair protein RadA [Saprospiraceae bacterium]